MGDSEADDVDTAVVGQDIPGTIEALTKSGRTFKSAASQAVAEFAQVYRATEGIITAAAATGKGTLIFAPAGNDGADVRVNSPISIATGVVSVGAVEPRPGGFAVPDFSKTGPTLIAPGQQVPGVRLGGGLTEMSGTSIA